MALLTTAGLLQLGFQAVGRNCKISDKASFYGCDRVSIGDNVRIDDFCVFSAGRGGIRIGNHIHIAVYSSLIGAGQITLSDFCNISSRVSIYSSSDDFSGEYMTNPVIPEAFTNVCHEPVFIGRHAVIGSGTVVLPGARLLDGVAIGALSVVKGVCAEFGIFAGVPAKLIRPRSRKLLEKESELAQSGQLRYSDAC